MLLNIDYLHLTLNQILEEDLHEKDTCIEIEPQKMNGFESLLIRYF